MKAPAFQFYPTDYLGSQRVQMMTLEEEGAYIRLLCSCWQHGSIPADPAQAARLIGKGASTTLATVVQAMFIAGESGRLIHDRLDAEREKQAVWREKSAAGGRKSAEIRKGGSTVVQPPYQPNGNTPSPSPSPSPIPITAPIPDPDLGRAMEDAENVWKSYPKKKGKQEALPEIKKAIKAQGFERILERTEAYASATDHWPEDEKKFIPDPVRWFKRGQYDDDPKTWERNTPSDGTNRYQRPAPTAEDHLRDGWK